MGELPFAASPQHQSFLSVAVWKTDLLRISEEEEDEDFKHEKSILKHGDAFLEMKVIAPLGPHQLAPALCLGVGCPGLCWQRGDRLQRAAPRPEYFRYLHFKQGIIYVFSLLSE